MISVVTPTYNRAHTLERVYRSLERQTAGGFEWLVVDDGSTDGTRMLLADLTQGAAFPVRVIEQANRGKHVALNVASSAARGTWILILDSDDALVPDAVATIRGDLDRHDRPDLVGLCYRKAYFDGAIIGVTNFDETPVCLDPTAANEAFRGDLAYVFRTAALRARPFPVLTGENFFPELYVWNRIADDGRILYFPQRVIYLCEYLPDGYSANFARNLRRNPRGFLAYYRDQVGRERTVTRRVKCLLRAAQCWCLAAARRVRP